MKKYLLIAVFLFIGIAFFGYNNFSSNENGADKTGSEQDELMRAEETLVSFFAYLSNQDFEKALSLFELSDDPANSWEGLEIFSLPEDRNDKTKVLKNYCQATGTCLKARVIETKKEYNDTYNLVVQFQNADDSVFVLGPCCGATEEEMPPQDKFNFKVKKINNVFKVATAPIYVP